ncbi:Bromodomain-containing protein, partial [Baffinella frigidus]
VDPEEDECPDYMKVIKAPMDLGTVKKVLNARKSYANPELFARDVRLTFNNAIKYNSKGHTVRQDAEHLLAMF